MAEAKNLYETLGVARDADRDAIRKAYRKLARQNHPDLNPGDKAAEQRFKEISKAWEVLEDAEKRRNYDEFGEISLEVGFDPEKARQAREAFGARFGFGSSGDPASHAQEFHFGDIDDLLGGFFGNRAEGGGLRLRGQDLEAALELEFLEAVRGGERRLTIARPTPNGPESETLTVKIPPGVSTGERLRLAGKGAPGIGGGPPGDLHVRLRVRPHRFFRREGKDLELDLPVSVREAILGGRVEVPTLDGRATLTIPPGTQSGTRLRMRGKGVPSRRGGGAGDLLARVQIRVPREIDDEAKAALDTLGRFEDPDLRKGLFS
ncbi:MAG: J domain-containing protein [Myxococcales bacterium]|nr:J domain-containing protein [Myxococcales bacterium]